MKCQILCSEGKKKKKNIINLLSAEFAQKVVNINLGQFSCNEANRKLPKLLSPSTETGLKSIPPSLVHFISMNLVQKHIF